MFFGMSAVDTYGKSRKRRFIPKYTDQKLFGVLGDDYLYSLDNLLDVLLLPGGMEEERYGLISERSCYGANYLRVVNGLGIGVLLGLEGEVSVAEAYALLISLLKIALGPKNTGARNTHTDKLLNELLSGDVDHIKVKKDGIPPISVLTLCGIYGNSLDTLKTCERLIVHCSVLETTLEVPVIKSLKFVETHN